MMQEGSADGNGISNVMDMPFVRPLPPLIAPLRFSIVAHSINASAHDANPTAQSIYKGGFPRRRNVAFLRRLRLKTMLSLTPKPIDALDLEVSKWAQSAGINLIHIKCEKPKEDGGGLSKEAAAKALMYLLDVRQLPIYVHCLDGQSVSTLLIGVLRKVQAWSSRTYMEEIKRSLGHNDEVIEYQRSFIDKIGKNDGIRLPPRRFLPEWTWSSPSPLSRLKDPYDVIMPTREKSSAMSGASTPTNSHLHGTHRKVENHDGPFASASGTSTSDTSPTTLQFSSGTLPVLHPLLKIRFDYDAELPIPVITHPSTPLHTRDASAFISPVPSRPPSRSGRHNTHNSGFHSNMHASDLRSSSRPASNQASPLMSIQNIAPSPTLDRSPSHSSHASRHSDFTFDEDKSNKRGILVDHSRISALHHQNLHHDSSSTPIKSSHLSNTSTPRASVSSPTIGHITTRSESLYGLGLQEGISESDGSNTRVNSSVAQIGTRPSIGNMRGRDFYGNREDRTPIDKSKRDYFLNQEDGQSNHHLPNGEASMGENRLVHERLLGHSHGNEDEREDSIKNVDSIDGNDLESQCLEKDDVDIEAKKRLEREEEEETEEEEDEESEEEEEEEEEENDGLALEALDLEGY